MAVRWESALAASVFAVADELELWRIREAREPTGLLVILVLDIAVVSNGLRFMLFQHAEVV